MIIQDIQEVAAFYTQKTDRIRTHEAYRMTIKRFFEYLVEKGLDKIEIQDFTKLNAIYYQDWWIKRGNANKTINSNVGHMRTFFEYFKYREIIKTNPFESIKTLKIVKSNAHQIFKKPIAKLIWDYMYKDYRGLYFFTKMIYYTFIRPKELLGLHVKDFDFDNNIIKINAGISKNKKSDYVVIPKSLLPILEEMDIKKLDPEMLVFSFKLKPGKTFWSRNRVSEMHREVLEYLEIPQGFDLYSWKHTGACAAYKAGLGVKEIQVQMRHADSKMTDTYLRSLGLMINDEIKDKEW